MIWLFLWYKFVKSTKNMVENICSFCLYLLIFYFYLFILLFASNSNTSWQSFLLNMVLNDMHRWLQNRVQNRAQYVPINECDSKEKYCSIWSSSGIHFRTFVVFGSYKNDLSLLFANDTTKICWSTVICFKPTSYRLMLKMYIYGVWRIKQQYENLHRMRKQSKFHQSIFESN